jgi:hypothetical protein
MTVYVMSSIFFAYASPKLEKMRRTSPHLSHPSRAANSKSRAPIPARRQAARVDPNSSRG